jgi:hypothetical protein
MPFKKCLTRTSQYPMEPQKSETDDIINGLPVRVCFISINVSANFSGIMGLDLNQVCPCNHLKYFQRKLNEMP